MREDGGGDWVKGGDLFGFGGRVGCRCTDMMGVQCEISDPVSSDRYVMGGEMWSRTYGQHVIHLRFIIPLHVIPYKQSSLREPDHIYTTTSHQTHTKPTRSADPETNDKAYS